MTEKESKQCMIAKLKKIGGNIHELERMISNGNDEIEIIDRLNTENRAIDQLAHMLIKNRKSEGSAIHPDNCKCML